MPPKLALGVSVRSYDRPCEKKRTAVIDWLDLEAFGLAGMNGRRVLIMHLFEIEKTSGPFPQADPFSPPPFSPHPSPFRFTPPHHRTLAPLLRV